MKVTLKCCCVALYTVMLSGMLGTAQAGQVSEAVADVGQRVFSELERELIREYYRERRTTERRDRLAAPKVAGAKRVRVTGNVS